MFFRHTLGVPYAPDATLLMGYSFGCGNRFSDEQAVRMAETLFHPSWSFLTDSNEPICQNINSSDQGFILRNCSNAGGINVTPFEGFSVNLKHTNMSQCGSIPSTDEEGRYLTFDCVYPYNGTGLLSILPEIDHASAVEGVTTFDLAGL